MITIELERPDDAAGIEDLLDRAFGVERHGKTAQRLRDGQRPARGLAFVARERGRPIGTLRFWSVRIGRLHRALLLGPIAVDPDCRNRGIGARLITTGLARAKSLGHRAVILVGDAPYYERFGFSSVLTAGMVLPGPVDRARFLAIEFVTGALAGAGGLVVPDVAETASPARSRVAPFATDVPMRLRAPMRRAAAA